ncbi:STAS domain-containing protein [Motiliproteus sediminis]|uniref:STAS domain-containing protein n=1 Tax=Motiliproteus sediminis TaxID=1468178 RepID=UPI001FE9F7D2|nr:STAS domain-containing protein [Motiliproteus sediminis]
MGSGLQLRTIDAHQARLEGEIDFATVVAVREQGEQLLREGSGELSFDFAGVVQTNTAALTLLLCWKRAASACGRELRFTNLPSELHSMAAVSELEELLR